MSILELILEIIAISSSGALSPGPLTFATLTLGSKRGWKAGFMAALGHTAFEFPLIMILAMGLSSLLANPVLLKIISILGGTSLIFFAAITLKDVFKSDNVGEVHSGAGIKGVKSGAFVSGLVFTALNPYFIIWWASGGLKLIADILSVGGVLLVGALYPFHVWMDFMWLSVVAFLASKGRAVGKRFQKIILFTFVLVLLYYGGLFILEGLAS